MNIGMEKYNKSAMPVNAEKYIYETYFCGIIKRLLLYACISTSGSEVIKLFSCWTQLSMKFFLPINVKMPTIVGILIFMSMKNTILGLSEPGKCLISCVFFILTSI